jgi:adenine/guanine phosphoribosyltransferase-like PRPP-binding protein
MKKKLVKKKPAPQKKIPLPPVVQTSYLTRVYNADQYQEMIPLAMKSVQEFSKKHKFDAIAFKGSSGAAIAYPLSYLLNLPLIHVRGNNKTNHYIHPIEGLISTKKYIIVDDFIASGDTMQEIINTISTELKGKAQPIGIVLYDSYRAVDYDNIPVINVPHFFLAQ